MSNEAKETTQQKPTGGKSSYYSIEIPLDAPSLEIDEENGVVRFMLEEYIKYGLANDFDRGNIAKANHRLGNKHGVDIEYDINKINHYCNRIKETLDDPYSTRFYTASEK